MKAEQILGKREDVKKALEKLGLDGKLREECEKKNYGKCGFTDESFIEVPEVGYVTTRPLYAKDMIDAYLGVTVNLHNTKQSFLDVLQHATDRIGWARSMILTRKAGLEPLSLHEYFKCLEWALENNNKDFYLSLKAHTWTKDIMVSSIDPLSHYFGDFDLKLAEHLMASHNFNGIDNLPVIVEDPDIIADNSFNFSLAGNWVMEGIKLEGGYLFTHPGGFSGTGTFNFSGIDESAGYPIKFCESNFSSIAVLVCNGMDGYYKMAPVLCGANIKTLEETYKSNVIQVVAKWEILEFHDLVVGCMARRP